MAPVSQQPQAKPGFLVAAVGNVLYALVPVAQAQDANLDISSPEIRAITSSMQARFGQLQKFFDSGALGMTQTGLIEVRDASAVSLPDRGVLNTPGGRGQSRSRGAVHGNRQGQWPPRVGCGHPQDLCAALG